MQDMQQPGRVDVYAQVAAEVQRGDPGFGLADQEPGQKPGGQRQFGRLHDIARLSRRPLTSSFSWPLQRGQRKRSGQRVFSKAASTTQKPKGYTLLLGAVVPLESRQREPQIKFILRPFTAQIDYAKAGLALFRRP
jgi:hypothetical protein